MLGGAYPECYAMASKGFCHSPGRDASLGFLDNDAPVLVLPITDKDGHISIKQSELGYNGTLLQLLVISGEQAVFNLVPINNSDDMQCKDLLFKDLRQKEDSNKVLIRSKVVSKVSQNNPLTLNTHEYEVLDSIEKLLDTVKTISNVGNAFANEFDFLKTWPTLSLEKKLELHERKVCHEFNLWLKKKDVSFFDDYVRPALKVKPDSNLENTQKIKKCLFSSIEQNPKVIHGFLSCG